MTTLTEHAPVLFWTEAGTVPEVLYGEGDVPATFGGAVAAFDLDDTLIRHTGGKKIRKTAADMAAWDWWHAMIAGHLRQLHDTGYVVVIVSNQSPLGKVGADDVLRQAFSMRAQAIGHQLGFRPFWLVAMGRNCFRKPGTGMWRLLRDKLPAIDVEHSFYVGDAAGRPGDFAASDALFAHNCGIRFATPNSFVAAANPASAVAMVVRLTTPAPIASADSTTNQAKHIVTEATAAAAGKPLAFLMTGPPASGKSTLARALVNAMGGQTVYVNQDELKTKARVEAAIRGAFASRRAVIVDKLLPSAAERAGIAAQLPGYAVVSVHMICSRENAERQNWIRSEITGCEMVPDIVYNIFYKALQPPNTASEALALVCAVPPVIATGTPAAALQHMCFE